MTIFDAPLIEMKRDTQSAHRMVVPLGNVIFHLHLQTLAKGIDLWIWSIVKFHHLMKYAFSLETDNNMHHKRKLEYNVNILSNKMFHM